VRANVWIPDGVQLSIRRAHYTDTSYATTLRLKFFQEFRQNLDSDALDLSLESPDSGLSIHPWHFHYFVVRLAGGRKTGIV
jgi:hypothetical protein